MKNSKLEQVEFQLKVEHLIHLLQGGNFRYRQGDLEINIYPPETDKVCITRGEYQHLKRNQTVYSQGMELDELSNDLLMEIARDTLLYVKKRHWPGENMIQTSDNHNFAFDAEAKLLDLIADLQKIIKNRKASSTQ